MDTVVGPLNPPFPFHRATAFEGLTYGRRRVFSIVRMYQARPCWLGPGKIARSQAVHGLEFRRPNVDTCLEVQIERTHARRLVSEHQSGSTLAQGIFSLLAFSDITRCDDQTLS